MIFLRNDRLLIKNPRDYWARNVSPNKDVKIYIGAPASSTAAGQGYENATTLSSIATQMRKSFPSFGGVMLWDASQAYGKALLSKFYISLMTVRTANGRYDEAIKSSLTAAGGTGFTYPPCSAPAYVSGTDYTQGEQVSSDG